jgi:TonB family protein
MTGSLSADAILSALADAARVLSGADGTAIASRNAGVIVCRARSGGMAPGLGAPLNSDSGISGECLRTASIQICSDAAADSRVDPEVCRALGIRSVAVVPLRGRMGIFGILEAFAARANAFEEEQIDSLRSLAEIAEMAYERERSAANSTATTSPVRAALFPVAASADRDQSSTQSSSKRYWIFGCVLVVVLAMAWIARVSWRQTGVEIAASTSTAQKVNPSTDLSALQLAAARKPEAAVRAYPADQARTRVLENAATVDRTPDPPIVLTPSKNPSLAESTINPKLRGEDNPLSAPPVEAAVSSVPGALPKFAPETPPLPRLGRGVSRGTDVPALALERVTPIYPREAQSRGISGDVILDATIARNGSIGKVTIISGPADLRDAAVTAVRKWRFSPALLNGKPVEVQRRITIAFKLP